MTISVSAGRQMLANMATGPTSPPKAIKVQNPVRVAESDRPVAVLKTDQSHYEKLREQSRQRIQSFFAQHPNLILAAEAAAGTDIPSRNVG